MTDNDEWNEERLRRLCDDSEGESHYREFKASRALDKTPNARAQLSKDVSAFANSAGGTIVFGIEENKDDRTFHVDQGSDESVISKEWLEQVIIDNIRPRLADFRIYQVPLLSKGIGRVAYVVEIGQSTTAHQANDLKYYMRNEFRSIAMYDEQIRDVMGRRKNPKLIPSFSFKRKQTSSVRHDYSLEITLRNEGAVRAVDTRLDIIFPSRLVSNHGGSFSATERFTTLVSDSNIKYENIKYTIRKSAFPIHPQSDWRVTDRNEYLFHYYVDKNILDFLYEALPRLSWTVYADDSPPLTDAINILEKLQEF